MTAFKQKARSVGCRIVNNLEWNEFGLDAAKAVMKVG